MNGEISSRMLKETCICVGECDATRMTSLQLVQLEDETSPKSSESSPCLLTEAMGRYRLQPPDVCIAREEPGLMVRKLPQLPLEILTGEAAGCVVHQAFTPMATKRKTTIAAAMTPAVLAMTGRRRRFLAAARTLDSSDGAAGTL